MKSKTFTRITKVLLLAVLFLFVGVRGWGQVSITALDLAYTQNFNSLNTSGSWANNSTLPGWYAKTFVNATLNTYSLSNGAPYVDGDASLCSFGSSASGDRALGYIPSSTIFGASGLGYVGWRFKNNSAYIVTRIDVTFTGEQWRDQYNASGGPGQTLTLRYQVSSSAISNLTGGTWVAANVSFDSPSNIFAGALDGNLPANRNTINAQIEVTIPIGSEIMLRWEDKYDVINSVNVNHLLGLDDVTVIARAAPQSPTAVTPTNVTTTSFRANWNSTPLAAHYTIELSDNDLNFNDPIVFGPTSNTYFDFNSLTEQHSYYYKVTAYNNIGNSNGSNAIPVESTTFTGSGNWDLSSTGAWDNEIPSGSNKYFAFIETGANCSVTSSATFNNGLIIKSGGVLNIEPDQSLTLTGTITNNAGTSGLILKSDASGTGSLIHNTANVNATVQRYISGSSNLVAKKYHLVSVPINSTTYLSGVWLDSYLFTYLEASNTWYIWDDPTNNVLQTKMGAMVFYPNWDATTSKTYNIIGQLNNGTYSPTVAYSGVGFGYNLVPNPYPSPIDWNAASGWTKTNISGTIWGFNSSTGSYGSWNGSTGTNSVGRYIPVGQAFYVQATGSPTLTMTNSVRLPNTTDFLKSGELAPNILHLTASGNGGQDEIAIQFSYDATETSLDTYDAAKFYSDMAVPQLSTYTSVDNTALSITGLPNNENTSIVPLRFEMDFTGEITFQASAIESFNNSTIIKLEDKQLSQILDLRTTPTYTFTHTPTDSPERFALHFGGVLGLENTVTEKLSTITVSGSTIYLNYPASNASIYATLFDVQGRLLKRMQLSNAGQDNFSISTDGIYILKLSLPSGTETHKIVVR